nr:Chain B, Agglutinin-like protein 5 [Candida albicans]
IATLYV